MPSLKELHQRGGSLVIPRTSATTVFAATQISYEVYPIAFRRGPAEQYFSNNLRFSTIDKIDELAKKLPIDKAMCLVLVKKIFVARSFMLMEPMTAFFNTPGFFSLIREEAGNDSLADDIYYYVASYPFNKTELFSAFIGDPKVNKARLVNKFTDRVSEKYYQEVSPISPAAYEEARRLFRLVINRLLTIANSVVNFDALDGSDEIGVLRAVYEDVFDCRVTAERLAAVWFNREAVLNVSMEDNQENLTIEEEVDMAFKEVDSLYAEFATLSKEGVSRADVMSMEDRYDVEIMSMTEKRALSVTRTPMTETLSMEGLISSIGKGLKKGALRIMKIIEKIINSLAKQFLRPFGIKLTFSVSETGDYLTKWGESFNTGLNDYIESIPPMLVNPEPIETLAAGLSAQARGIADILTVLHENTARDYKAKEPKFIKKHIEVASAELITVSKTLAHLYGESGAFSGLVLTPPELENYDVVNMVASTHPLVVTGKAVRELINHKASSNVAKRTPRDNVVSLMLTVADEKRFEKTADLIAKYIDEIDSARESLEKRTGVIDSVNKPPYDLTQLGAKGVAAETQRTKSNELYSSGLRLLSAVVLASSSYLTAYRKVASVTLQMRVQAEAIDKA